MRKMRVASSRRAQGFVSAGGRERRWRGHKRRAVHEKISDVPLENKEVCCALAPLLPPMLSRTCCDDNVRRRRSKVDRIPAKHVVRIGYLQFHQFWHYFPS